MTWEKVACDLCGGKNLKVYLQEVTTWEHSGKFNYVKCRDCGLVFMNPRPPLKEIGRYYPAETYWSGQNIRQSSSAVFDKKWKQERDKRFKSLYSEIFKRFPQPALPAGRQARILDIGCGTNGFLTAFKEQGWQVLGTDLSPEAAHYSEQTYGFKVLVGDLLELDFGKEKFDVVALNGVLEHLYSPAKTLEKIKKLLVKDGFLALMVPNLESFGARIFKDDWWLLQPPRHLYHFSPKTITLLLKKTGFGVLSINHFSWVHNYYSLFESFRFRFSPRFRKAINGGLERSGQSHYPNFFSLIKRETGKIVAVLFASFMTIFGSVLKRGEQMAVYAKKA